MMKGISLCTSTGIVEFKDSTCQGGVSIQKSSISAENFEQIYNGAPLIKGQIGSPILIEYELNAKKELRILSIITSEIAAEWINDPNNQGGGY